MNQRQAVVLTRRYQAQLNSVASKTAATVARTWDDLGSWDHADVDSFTSSALPALHGAQRQATALTVAYLGLVVGAQMPVVDPSQFLDRLDPREPFLAYWAALNRGAQWEQAITAGRTRAEDLALDGTTTAARGTASEIDDQEDRITGWERVPGGVCCEWCATVATQRYQSAESADFGHDRCNCAVTPIVGKLAPGRAINRPLLEKNIPADQATGYVTATGEPAERPAPAPVEAP